eukprot:COSAG02_NODE_8695_length_2477_cov_1.684188_2_plen_81_part_00
MSCGLTDARFHLCLRPSGQIAYPLNLQSNGRSKIYKYLQIDPERLPSNILPKCDAGRLLLTVNVPSEVHCESILERLTDR